MRRLALAVYAIFGTLAIGLGVLVLFKPSLALHPEDFSPLTVHLIREQGAEGVFIGLMTLWCLVNFDRRRPVHLALLVFTALFAAIHWVEYLNARRHLASPLLNSLPFLAFAATAPFRAAGPDNRARPSG